MQFNPSSALLRHLQKLRNIYITLQCLKITNKNIFIKFRNTGIVSISHSKFYSWFHPDFFCIIQSTEKDIADPNPLLPCSNRKNGANMCTTLLCKQKAKHFY